MIQSPDRRQLRRSVTGGKLHDRAEAVRPVAQAVAAVDGCHLLAARFAAPFVHDDEAAIAAASGDLIAAQSANPGLGTL